MNAQTNKTEVTATDNSQNQKTEAQVKTEMNKVITKDHTTKSSKIRALDASGYTRSQIANFLGIRYQHVRNVLVTPLKGGNTTSTSTKS